jgi:hypothetical protein
MLRRQTPSVQVKEGLLQGTKQEPNAQNERYGNGCMIKRQENQEGNKWPHKACVDFVGNCDFGCRSSLVDPSANGTWGVGRGLEVNGDCHPVFRRASRTWSPNQIPCKSAQVRAPLQRMTSQAEHCP